MSTRHASSVRALHPFRWPTRRGFDASGDIRFAVLIAAAAGAVGYLFARGAQSAALLLALLPLALWLLAQPFLSLVALGASIPALMSVSGQAGGLHIALSDLLLVVVGATLLLDRTKAGIRAALRAVRPVVLPLLPYCAVVLILLPIHFGLGEITQTAQRYELFVLPLLAGAYAALRNQHIRVLQAYILVTTILAAVWRIHDFGMQKNPVGQLITNAILLVIGARSLRRLSPCLLVLVPGLLLTESRGALGALAIGIAVLVAMHGFGARPIVTRAVPVLLLALGVFALMPATLRARLTTFSAGVNTPAAYSLHIRQQYASDARRIIAQHQWTGVGVGGYGRADSVSSIPADDPHEVLLLQAAEGGYVLAAAFVVLIVGAGLVLLRMRRLDLAVPATAVLIATAAHGLVDVYWVRGTPVLSWLLLGMVCAVYTRHRAGVAAQ